MKRTCRALTLIEVLVANTLLLLLMGAVFMIYCQGSKGWRKGGIQADLLQQLQVLSARVVSGLEQSSADSLTVATSALCFLVPEGVQVDSYSGKTVWNRYVIFFQRGTDVVVREVPLDPFAEQKNYPTPIEQYSDSGTRRPLSAYLQGGRVVARGIKTFKVEHLPTSQLVRVTMVAEIDRGQREQATLATMVRLP